MEKNEKKPIIWDIVKNISENKDENLFKKGGIVDAYIEKIYNSFLINRSFSYFTDTIFLAQEMNQSFSIPKYCQYKFLKELIRKKKRFAKWEKKDLKEMEKIKIISEYFGYNLEKSKTTLKILSKEQFNIIKEKIDLQKEKKNEN